LSDFLARRANLSGKVAAVLGGAARGVSRARAKTAPVRRSTSMRWSVPAEAIWFKKLNSVRIIA